MIYDLATIFILIIASIRDITTKEVENYYFYFLLLLSIIRGINITISLAIYVVFLIIVKKIFDKGIGYGDIKILIGISFVSSLESSLYSFLIAVILAYFYMIIIKKEKIAFIPFITISYICIIGLETLTKNIGMI